MTVSTSQTIGIGPNKVILDFVKSWASTPYKRWNAPLKKVGSFFFRNMGLSLLIVALIYSAKVEKMFNLHCKLTIVYTGTDQYKNV